MVEIAQVCKKHNVWLVVDEAYEHFLHDSERWLLTDVVERWICSPMSSRSRDVCQHDVASIT